MSWHSVRIGHRRSVSFPGLAGDTGIPGGTGRYIKGVTGDTGQTGPRGATVSCNIFLFDPHTPNVFSRTYPKCRSSDYFGPCPPFVHWSSL